MRLVPLLPRILRLGRQNVYVEREHFDFVLFFYTLKWEVPDRAAIGRGEGGVGVYTNKEYMDKGAEGVP